MKKVSIVSLIAVLAIIVSSCGSSNNVVSNNGISKRKYNKGFFFNRKSNLKTADAKVKDADLKEDKSIAKAEKVEARKAKKANRIETRTENSSVAQVESEETNEEVTGNVSEGNIQTRVENSSEDALVLEETENQVSETEESVRETNESNQDARSKKSSNNRGAGGSVHIVILVILALIIPPLAVFLFEGVTGRFWIDLILALLGIGLGIGLGGIAYLAALAAVIYALLIVLNVI